MSMMINGTGDSVSMSGDIREWWGLRKNGQLALSTPGATTTQAGGCHVGMRTFCYQSLRLGK